MKRLRRTPIDFAGRADGASASGVAALLLGAGAMMLAIAVFQDIQARATLVEAQLDRSGKRASDAGAGNARQFGDAVKRANAVARDLSRPWDSVFVAIESAVAGDVALLAIEPDAGKGVVRVTAEARDKDAMLRYVTRLQAQQPLRRVQLERHEVLVLEPERPVRFVVAGGWGEGP